MYRIRCRPEGRQAIVPASRLPARSAMLVGMDLNGYSRPTAFHRLTLDGGRIMFTDEDIGSPAEAGRFLIELGADPADQAIVDAPGRRWQARVADLGLIVGCASDGRIILQESEHFLDIFRNYGDTF